MIQLRPICPDMWRDYELSRVDPVLTIAEVMNAVDGETIALRVFTGPLHRLRAALWGRWHTRKAVHRLAWHG